MGNLDVKRWIVVFAGVLIVFCSGGAYTFSVFLASLMELLNASRTEVMVAFSLNLGCLPIGVLIGGKIADTKSPKTIIGVGGVVLGIGMFLTGFTSSLLWLYVTFGVILSLGSGASYGAAIGTAVKWFPDRRGLIAGIVVSALGLGTFVMAPLAKHLISIETIGALGTFKIFGIGIVIIAIIASLFIKLPPADYVPTGFVPKTGPSKVGKDVTWKEMMGTSRFWLLWILYALGAYTGLMIIGAASPIMQEMARLSEVAAAFYVGFLGLVNSGGRLFWGGLSDKLGRNLTLAVMFLITGLMVLLLSPLSHVPILFVIAIMLIALCYGGYLGLFPSLCADAFGSKNLTFNYGVLFTAFSVAAVTGPLIGSWLKETTGGYTMSMTVAGIIAGVGFIVALAISLADKKAAQTAE